MDSRSATAAGLSGGKARAADSPYAGPGGRDSGRGRRLTAKRVGPARGATHARRPRSGYLAAVRVSEPRSQRFRYSLYTWKSSRWLCTL